MDRSPRGDRLGLTAEGPAGGDVAGQQASPAQLPDRPRVAPGEGAALRLDVAQPHPRRLAGEGPGQRGQLGVQGDHRHRPSQRELERLVVHRLDRVLEARVVELHDAVVGGRAAGAREAPGQVDVDDVEAPRAEVEVEGLDVDDHLVADLGASDQADVGDRRAPFRVPSRGPLELDDQRLLGLRGAVRGGRRGGVEHLDDRAGAKLQHRLSTLARACGRGRHGLLHQRQRDPEHLRQGVVGDALPRLVRAVGAVGEVDAVEAGGDQGVDVRAAPAGDPLRLAPAPPQGRLGDGDRLPAGRLAVAGEGLLDGRRLRPRRSRGGGRRR